VRIRVLGAHGGSSPRHRQTSFLLNDGVCLDAGAVTEALSLEEQMRVHAVLVTHSHLDHVAALPFLVENVLGRAREPVEVAAPAEVIASLRRHLFNDDIWPDFSRLPDRRLPTVTFRVLEWNVPERVNGLTADSENPGHLGLGTSLLEGSHRLEADRFLCRGGQRPKIGMFHADKLS
jgi:glyoxylase-like metal-dependent hydrolase (beta-lactamase superfamily II)